MPNAAATFDDDFGYASPARKSAPRKPRPAGSKKKRKKGRRLPIDMHKVARVAAIGMGATLALGIMVNALMLQKGRHPAPLFGKVFALVAPATIPHPQVAKLSVPATSPAAAAPRAAAEPSPSEVPAVPAPAPRPRQADAQVKGQANGDAIARLLQGGAPSTTVAEKPDAHMVLGVQRGLAKLGFAVKANGSFGPATRKAIETFEKDRHLPVKGEMTHRLVKIIAAESGVRND